MHAIAKYLSATAIILMPAFAFAADAPAALTEAQQAEVKELVRSLLTKEEPDLVIKAAHEAQSREEKDIASQGQKALSTSRDKIFNDANAPVVGNVKGDVTMVEFFDYQCGYCKMAHEAIVKLMETDKNVKLIYKEFPILGEGSVQASRAALASVRQNKYEAFHNALMATKAHLTEDIVLKVAKDTGLDLEKLKKDMDDESIEKIVKANLELGSQIGARGTPTFVIGEQVYPGAMQYDQMKQAVDTARQNAKK